LTLLFCLIKNIIFYLFNLSILFLNNRIYFLRSCLFLTLYLPVYKYIHWLFLVPVTSGNLDLLCHCAVRQPQYFRLFWWCSYTHCLRVIWTHSNNLLFPSMFEWKLHQFCILEYSRCGHLELIYNISFMITLLCEVIFKNVSSDIFCLF
jgi:hypothetical protein